MMYSGLYQAVVTFYAVNRIIMDTTNAKRAIDSIRAKHSILVDINSFLADGFRAIDCISDENKFPSPIPTPNNAITEIPAPINFAALASIINSPFLMFLSL